MRSQWRMPHAHATACNVHAVAHMQTRMCIRSHGRSVDLVGHGDVDYKIPSHPLVSYLKNLLPSFAANTVLQLVSALVFTQIEDWSFGAALYHCVRMCIGAAMCMCMLHVKCACACAWGHALSLRALASLDHAARFTVTGSARLQHCTYVTC